MKDKLKNISKVTKKVKTARFEKHPDPFTMQLANTPFVNGNKLHLSFMPAESGSHFFVSFKNDQKV